MFQVIGKDIEKELNNFLVAGVVEDYDFDLFKSVFKTEFALIGEDKQSREHTLKMLSVLCAKNYASNAEALIYVKEGNSLSLFKHCIVYDKDTNNIYVVGIDNEQYYRDLLIMDLCKRIFNISEPNFELIKKHTAAINCDIQEETFLRNIPDKTPVTILGETISKIMMGLAILKVDDSNELNKALSKLDLKIMPLPTAMNNLYHYYVLKEDVLVPISNREKAAWPFIYSTKDLDDIFNAANKDYSYGLERIVL